MLLKIFVLTIYVTSNFSYYGPKNFLLFNILNGKTVVKPQYKRFFVTIMLNEISITLDVFRQDCCSLQVVF